MPRNEKSGTKNERIITRVLFASYHDSGKSSKVFGWSVGQNKSFSKNSKTNFPDKYNELGVLCQEMKNLGPKMSEWCCGC